MKLKGFSNSHVEMFKAIKILKPFFRVQKSKKKEKNDTKIQMKMDSGYTTKS